MAVVFKTLEVIEIDGIPAGNIVDVISNHPQRRTEVLAAFGVFVESLKAELAKERDKVIADLAELTADLQTASTQLEAATNQLAAANATIETLQARIDELENPPNPFPDADWQGFRQAALTDDAVLRVASGNAVLWPVLFAYLSELSTNPARGRDIAWLWNTMEAQTPVSKEEVARVNGIAQRFGVPLRMNDEGQIEL
jgi:hypothetical protein